MIKADAITRTYGEFTAVSGVSFEIGPREIVGLLGHNGAGKTTIMKMITGCLEPSSGTIAVNGLNVVNDRIAVQRDIGYLPENCPLYPDMTVIGYLEYAASLKGVPSDQVADRIRYAIKKTSLGDVAMRPVANLSRGYKQRLGVAQAILHSPKLLILDEPTNGLDPSQIFEMRALIKELAGNATVVVSTHILQEVQAVCKRVIIINRGRLALDESMARLQSAGRLVVQTDIDSRRIAELVRNIPQLSITGEEKLEGAIRYTIDLQGQQPEVVAPRLAKSIVEAGGNLFALNPVARDLETIFGEISRGSAVDTDRRGVQTAELAAVAGKDGEHLG